MMEKHDGDRQGHGDEARRWKLMDKKKMEVSE